MRLTQVLRRQHIGRHFTDHWSVQGRRKAIETNARKRLVEKGIPICNAQDVLREERTRENIQVIGFKEKPLPLDETHPNWHPRTLLTFKDNNVLLEGLQQAKIITNTVELKDGLPESLDPKPLSKSMHKRVKQIIQNCNIFDGEQKKLPKLKDPERPAWNFPRVYGITQERRSMQLISKLLHVIESADESNSSAHRYISNNLFFSYPFEKSNDLIQFQLRGETLVTTSQPLTALTNEPTEHLDLPELFPVKPTITLNQENIYTLENIYPFKGENSHVVHPHTLFVNYDQETVGNLFKETVTETQIHGRTLLKAFTVAASYARSMHGDVGALPRPVVLHCIQTDGRWFHFGALQLNTLDVDGSAQKNVWYQTAILPMFQKCCYESGRPVLEGYNSDIIERVASIYHSC